jgi:signal peptidase I
MNQSESWSDNLNKIEEPSNDKFSFLEFIWDVVKTAVVALLLAFGIKYFIIQPFIVDGNSMLPNFENNEYLLVEKISYRFNQPARGDVIVFHPPGIASENYIKRIVGLPGETVEIKENIITIFNSDHPSGVALNEPYIPSSSQTLTESKDAKFSIGQDEYFVLGDNRQHSSDSREWGKLPKTNIIGKSWLNIFPFKNFGLVEHQNLNL